MAKRFASHTHLITRLAAELNRLDAKRDAIVSRLRAAMADLTGAAPAGASGSQGAATGAQRRGRGGRPKGFKVSAATRAKLRAAWKRRKAGKDS